MKLSWQEVWGYSKASLGMESLVLSGMHEMRHGGSWDVILTDSRWRSLAEDGKCLIVQVRLKINNTYHISEFGTKWDIREESARWEVRCIRGKTHLKELLQHATTTRFANTFSTWHPHPSCRGTSQTASGYFRRKGQGSHLSCEWLSLYFVTSGYILEPGTESWRILRLWSTQSSHPLTN